MAPPDLVPATRAPLSTQAHWHSNSEHVLDGDMAPLELHIVTAVDNTTDGERGGKRGAASAGACLPMDLHC